MADTIIHSADRNNRPVGGEMVSPSTYRTGFMNWLTA